MEYRFCNDIGVQFIDVGNDVFPMTGNAGALDLFFHERIQFFDHIQRIDFTGKSADFIHGQGIGKAQFQIRCLIAKYFFAVVIGYAGRNDADFRIVHFFKIERRLFTVFFQFLFPFFDDVTAHFGNSRHRIHLVPLFDIRNGFERYPFTQFNEALGMIDTSRHAQHDRRTIGFADFVCFSHHILSFLGIGRFQHGNLGKLGIVTVVLFILGRMHARVIGRNEDKAAVDGQIGKSKERISCHIETYHLHSCKGADATNGCADSCFHGNLFIRCPFGRNIFIFSHIFQDFCAGRTGVSGSKADTCFI